MLSGANAFEISDIEKVEHRGASAGRLARNNVTFPVVTRHNNSPVTARTFFKKPLFLLGKVARPATRVTEDT